MALKFSSNWRVNPPEDGMFLNQRIPEAAIEEFINLIMKVATKGKRWQVLEHFKSYFCQASSDSYTRSSREFWVENDLKNSANKAAKNAPLFIEAFYDACKSYSGENSDLWAPDTTMINEVLARHGIGYLIKPPLLELRENSETQDRIFLCHASEDKEHVIEVYWKLKMVGLNPWLDKIDLLPGQDWDREIRRALKNSDFIIIFFSQHSVSKRGYVQREFKLALDTLQEIPEGQIFIFPVRLDNCIIPESFSHIHYVDLFEEGSIEKIVNTIHSFSSISTAKTGKLIKGNPHSTNLHDDLNQTSGEVISDIKHHLTSSLDEVIGLDVTSSYKNDLTDKAKTILLEASQDPSGLIRTYSIQGGEWGIQTDNKVLFKGTELEERLTWEAALEELYIRNMLKKLEQKQKYSMGYRITAKGFDVVKNLLLS